MIFILLLNYPLFSYFYQALILVFDFRYFYLTILQILFCIFHITEAKFRFFSFLTFLIFFPSIFLFQILSLNQFLIEKKRHFVKFENEFYPKVPTELAMKTTTLISKSEFNTSDRVINLMSYFDGMEKVMKSLLIISMALAMREVLYSAYFESMQYFKNGEKNEKDKMHNRHNSEVIQKIF